MIEEREVAIADAGARPPGLRRRIELHPRAGSIVAALEDDFHRFVLRLDHAQGVIVAAEARTERAPHTGCPGAGPFIAGEAVGKRLDDLAALPAVDHCTHLHDLIHLAAARALDTEPTVFEMAVDDRVDGRTTATLARDGREEMRWELDGTAIGGSGAWAGRDLKGLSRWRTTLDPRDAENAVVLRRAVMISGGRRTVDDAGPATERTNRMGVCFNYQLPQARDSYQIPGWRVDFSRSGRTLLDGFDARGESARA